MKLRQNSLLSLLSFIIALAFLETINADEATAAKEDVAQKLVLNGSALRTKYSFKVYRVRLYLTKTSADEKAIYKDPNKKRIYINMMREVSGKKFDATVRKNIKVNLSAEQQKKYHKHLEAFLACFYDKILHDGCSVSIDYLPGKGTQVSIDDKVIDLIEGDEFYSHLLRLWIGNPLQKSIKTGLLGKD